MYTELLRAAGDPVARLYDGVHDRWERWDRERKREWKKEWARHHARPARIFQPQQ